MKLLGSFTSPYVRKVRVVLHEKKIDYTMVLEDVWAPGTTISEYNPLGKVPCLLMEDGETLFDSRVICEYVDTLTPVGKLLPALGRERAAVRCLEALADGVMDATVLIRLETTQRAEHERSAQWIQRQRLKIEASVDAMSKALGERSWLANNRLTLADLTFGCALSYLDFRSPDIDWRRSHSALARYFDKLMQRQSFVDTAPDAKVAS